MRKDSCENARVLHSHGVHFSQRQVQPTPRCKLGQSSATP